MTHDDHVKSELKRVDTEGEPSIIDEDSKKLAGIADDTQKDFNVKSNLLNGANGDLKKENLKFSQNDDEVTAVKLNFNIKGHQPENLLNIETESQQQTCLSIKEDVEYQAEKMTTGTGVRALRRHESDKVEVTLAQAEVTLAQAEEELLEQEAESFFLLCSSIEISLEQYFDTR